MRKVSTRVDNNKLTPVHTSCPTMTLQEYCISYSGYSQMKAKSVSEREIKTKIQNGSTLILSLRKLLLKPSMCVSWLRHVETNV